MKTVRVALGERSYPILIGRGAAAKAARQLGGPGRAFIVADRRLGSQTTALVRSLKAGGWDTYLVRVPATEAFKDFGRIYPLYSELLRARADRHTVLFALGGGVIGDAAGFLAGTYMRGLRWVGLPTTLLAQVDSSIGGKTGVNHAAGKNLIGLFHQPALVACDLEFLKTLPERERVSGLGEMIKYGLIYDAPFYGWLEKHWERVVSGESQSLEAAIARCARWKARAVARDERDESGVREVLNFGHTLGHALEGATRYATFRHGEAIILGMRAAVSISVQRGHLKSAIGARVDSFLGSLPVPKVPGGVTPEKLLEFVRKDKKAKAGRVRFVLLRAIGKTTLDRHVTDDEIRTACLHIGRRAK
jgi:3-dehydroquinate synthase